MHLNYFQGLTGLSIAVKINGLEAFTQNLGFYTFIVSSDFREISNDLTRDPFPEFKGYTFCGISIRKSIISKAHP